MRSILKDESGQVYRSWKVLSFVGKSKSTNGSEWNCECIRCGSLINIRGSNLRRLRLPDCKTCCKKCGRSRPAVIFKGNKRICCECDNTRVRIWKFGNAEYRAGFKKWVEEHPDNIASHRLRNKEYRQSSPIIFLSNMLGMKKKFYNTCKAAADGPMARRFRKRHDSMVVLITINDLMVLWEGQQGRCAITNTKMSHRHNDLKSVSIDRIDSSKGYVPGNVQLTCRWVNVAKNKFSNDDIKNVLAELTDKTCTAN